MTDDRAAFDEWWATLGAGIGERSKRFAWGGWMANKRRREKEKRAERALADLRDAAGIPESATQSEACLEVKKQAAMAARADRERRLFGGTQRPSPEGLHAQKLREMDHSEAELADAQALERGADDHWEQGQRDKTED